MAPRVTGALMKRRGSGAPSRSGETWAGGEEGERSLGGRGGGEVGESSDGQVWVSVESCKQWTFLRDKDLVKDKDL